MTLIIAGICKNSVCICADKRRTIKHTNAPTEKKDDQYKIYKFATFPIIIYNHGINEINGKIDNYRERRGRIKCQDCSTTRIN